MKKTIVLSLLVSLLCVTGVVQAKDFALFDDTERGVQFFDGSDVGNVGRRITTSGQIKNAVVGDVLTLNIEGQDYRIIIKKRKQYTADIVNLIGYIQNTQHKMILTRGTSGSTGTIETEKGTYEITSTQTGEWLLSPIDKRPLKRRPFIDKITRPPSNTTSSNTTTPTPRQIQPLGNPNSTDQAEIDIMVFWDSAFETRVGSASRALTALYNKISTTNQAFQDSDIYITLNLVHSDKIAYSETKDNSDALEAMRNHTGVFSNIPTLRTRYGADLVGFIRKDRDTYSSGGIAYVLGKQGHMRTGDDGDKKNAFFVAVDEENAVFFSNIAFMHEIGHNLGSFHDRNHADTSDGPPIFPYSYGHDDCLNGDDCGTFGTIMSYDEPQVAKFSNPTKSCNGKPCGIASDKSNPANNAKGFNNIRFDVANFYVYPVNISAQSREIAENSGINANVGDVLTVSGTPDAYEITSGNTTLFEIDDSGQIKAKSSLNFEEDTREYTLTVEVTKANATPESADITINVTDVDEPPTITYGLARTINVVAGNTSITTINATDEDAGQTPSLSLSDSSLFSLIGDVLSFKTAQTFDSVTLANNLKTVTITANSGEKSFSQVITVKTVQFIDVDNDGMGDQWERDNFDDLNTSDGMGDADGDGVSDKDEFIANTDPKVDDVKPVFTAISKVTLNAKGKKTAFALSAFRVSANDAKDGILTNIQPVNTTNTTISAGKLILTSGRHSLEWKATDAAGNSTTATQTVDVLPIANFAIEQFTSEGQTATVRVFLSGVAPSYPVLIPFSVSGNVDTDDYSVTSPIEITSGQEGSGVVTIKSNADVAEETMTLTMGVLTNAVKGDKDTHNITIVVTNIAPKIESFTVIQNSIKGTSIKLTNQEVAVTAEAFDANNDVLTYVWSISGQSISAFHNNTIIITRPIDLVTDHPITVTVTDTNNASVKRTMHIKVTAPITHDTTKDTDGDGILDKDEAGDNDGNGIPDYQEIPHQPNELVTQGDKQMIVPVGNRLLVGTMADDSAKLTINDIQNYRTHNGDSAFQADTYTSNHIYDYTIEGLAKAGEVVSVVIETAPMRANTILRKYNLSSNSWSSFKTDENNKYYSTTVITGTSCPVAGSNSWGTENTLQNGANCLLIMIEDGGDNDADAEKNGSIDDPLSLSTPITPSSRSSSGSGGGGGGCVYNPNAPARLDMIFILLTVLSTYYLVRRRRRIFEG